MVNGSSSSTTRIRGLVSRHLSWKASRRAGQSIIVANDAVAAVALGGLEAAVGALHEGPRALALAIGRDPSRHRQPADALAGGALHQVRGHDTAADVIGNGQCRM